MLNERDIIQQTAEHVRRLLSGEGSGHDWFHIERVRRTALAMAGEEHADLFVVELAALLHDVADWKFAGGDHEAGPRAARDLACITECVARSSSTTSAKSSPASPSKAPASPRPCGRSKARSCRTPTAWTPSAPSASPGPSPTAATRAVPLYDPAVAPESHDSFEAYKKNTGPTINHFYEKLLLLQDRMNTTAGKRLAAARHDFMDRYLEQFFAEWEGKR